MGQLGRQTRLFNCIDSSFSSVKFATAWAPSSAQDAGRNGTKNTPIIQSERCISRKNTQKSKFLPQAKSLQTEFLERCFKKKNKMFLLQTSTSTRYSDI